MTSLQYTHLATTGDKCGSLVRTFWAVLALPCRQREGIQAKQATRRHFPFGFAFNSSRPTPHLTMKTELCFALNPSQCHIHLGKPTESAGISRHLCACSHGSAVALCHCDATVRPLLCLIEKLEATILPLSDFDNACGKQAPQAYIRRPRHLWILQLFNSPAFESCSS